MDIQLDKCAKQDAYAKKIIDRTRNRIAKRKNALPPFLMVRAGLLNSWIPVTAIIGACTGYLIKMRQNPGINATEPVVIGVSLCALGAVVGLIVTDKQKKSMQQDINTIQTECYKYIHNNGYTLEFSNAVKNKKLMRILIEHIVKYEPGIFDKMMAKPESVYDFDVRGDIIGQHLKTHPADAQRILDAFDAESIPDHVYRRVNRYAARLKNSQPAR